MTWVAPPSPTSRPPWGWWVTAALLLLIAVGCFAASLRSQEDPAADRAMSQAAPASAQPAPSASAGTAAPLLASSLPVTLRIPAIGVSVAVSTLGLNPDKTVEVPTDYRQPGWFRLGPTPGQVGSAVILGHVDSYRGPAVFYRLRSLQAGDRVEIDLANGMTAQFVVNAVATYPKDQFPGSEVYASQGYSALQLVTCGGEFDTGARSYLSNVVVYTSLVAVAPMTAPAAAAAHN